MIWRNHTPFPLLVSLTAWQNCASTIFKYMLVPHLLFAKCATGLKHHLVFFFYQNG